MTAAAWGGTGHGDGQVLQECVEALGHAAMTVEEVQHFIEQQQHGRIRRGEHPGQRLGSRRRGLSGGAERCDTPIARQLASHVDPGRLPPLGRVPGIADKHRDAG